MSTQGRMNKGIIVLAITVILIALRDCLNFSIGFNIFSGICLIASLFLSQKERFVYLFLLLPFSRGLPYSEMILIVLAIDIADAALVKKECKIRIGMYLPILGVIIIEILDTIKYGIDNVELVYLVFYMLAATYAVDCHVFQDEEETYIYGYSTCTIAAIALVVIREISELGLNYIFTYNVRFGANTNGRVVTNFNSNELGLYCVVAICLLMVLNLKRNKKSAFAMAVLLSMLGLVSISRTFIMLMVVSWLFYLILSKKSITKGLAVAIAFSIAFLVVQSLAPNFVDWIKNYFVARSHTSGGRMNLVVDYFNWSFADMWTILFGYSEYYTQILNSTAAHNGIQEIMVCWGIVGLVICFLWFDMLIRYSCNGIRKSLDQWLPALVFFAFIQSVQLFTMHGYLLLMVLALSVLGMRGEDINEQGIEKFDIR